MLHSPTALDRLSKASTALLQATSLSIAEDGGTADKEVLTQHRILSSCSSAATTPKIGSLTRPSYLPQNRVVECCQAPCHVAPKTAWVYCPTLLLKMPRLEDRLIPSWVNSTFSIIQDPVDLCMQLFQQTIQYCHQSSSA